MGENNSIPINFKIYRKDASGKPNFLREEDFDQEVIKVGKGSAANLRLDDDTVALMHAYIQINENNEIHISDVVSKTGTIVNGNKVHKEKLNPGDEILLGNSLLVVNFEAAQEQAAPVEAAIPDSAAGGQSTFTADPAVMSTFSSEPVDLTKYEDETKRQAMVVTTFQDRKALQKNVLRDHIAGEKSGLPAKIALFLGIILVLGGMFMGYKALNIVKEEQRVNDIIREIAKDKGLSDKFVPKVQGNFGVEIAGILLTIFGATIFVTGMATVFKRKNILANYTIGEDPESNFHCSSENLPDPKFPLVKTDRIEGYHLLFNDKMEGSVTEPSGKKYMLTELIQQGQAQSAEVYPNTYDYIIPNDHVVEVKMGDYSWEIKAMKQPKLILPFNLPKEIFYLQLFLWIGVVGVFAWYFNYIQGDELFSQDVEQQQVT
nr:FHA domain-containing protein [Deltaproteobacteria bacterium]